MFLPVQRHDGWEMARPVEIRVIVASIAIRYLKDMALFRVVNIGESGGYPGLCRSLVKAERCRNAIENKLTVFQLHICTVSSPVRALVGDVPSNSEWAHISPVLCPLLRPD